MWSCIVLPFSVFLLLRFCEGGTLESNCVRGTGEHVAKWTVSSILVEPFLMTESSLPAQSSGGKYSGFIVDLLDKMTQKLGVSYEISLVPDKRYGKQEGDKWNGLIGQVCDGKAHIAAAPITVTVDREEAVDFTYSLLNIKAVSVIRKRSHDPQIASLEALLDNGYQLGVLHNSPIQRVLATSTDELHQRVWENINKGGIEESNEKGMRRVRGERKFAYIVEDAVANYVFKKPPCGLQTVETNLYDRKYAFAVAQYSSLRDQINSIIVDWQMNGTLDEVRRKWWGEDECITSASVSLNTYTLYLAVISILCSISHRSHFV